MSWNAVLIDGPIPTFQSLTVCLQFADEAEARAHLADYWTAGG